MSKKKKKPKHYWNHRIVTYLVPKTIATESYRVFSIAEVHYEQDKPISYGSDLKVLTEYESLKDLKMIYKKIKGAFRKSILDMDNWPNKWTRIGTKKKIKK